MEFLMSDCDIELVQVSCTNPDCPNLIWITKKQKRKIYLESFLRYGRIELPYCCKACQEAHMKALSASIQFTPSPIKNHGEGLIQT